jgi:hypothetical protein
VVEEVLRVKRLVEEHNPSGCYPFDKLWHPTANRVMGVAEALAAVIDAARPTALAPPLKERASSRASRL